MTTLGPWLDDSVPVWQEVGTASTADGSRTVQYQASASRGAADDAAWAATVAAAWSHEVMNYAGPGGVRSQLEVVQSGINTSATFYVSWVTVQRTAITVTSGQLPLTVMDGGGSFLDPTVVGVEWEPVDLPIDQRLTVAVMSLNANNVAGGYTAGELAYVKLGQANPTPDPYAPGWLTGASIAGRSTLATITMGTTFGQVVITDLPIGLAGDASLAMTVIDPFTQAQTPPPRPAPAGGTRDEERNSPFRATLEAAYKPRYRLIYADPVPIGSWAPAPPAQLTGRADGLGPLGGAARLDTRAPSRQSGFHPGGYY